MTNGQRIQTVKPTVWHIALVKSGVKSEAVVLLVTSCVSNIQMRDVKGKVLCSTNLRSNAGFYLLQSALVDGDLHIQRGTKPPGLSITASA